MLEDEAQASDEVETTKAQAPAPPTKKVRVLSEHGLFKNGQHYPEGDVLEISEQAAVNFIAAGDVELV